LDDLIWIENTLHNNLNGQIAQSVAESVFAKFCVTTEDREP
jgi:hypothetical protein